MVLFFRKLGYKQSLTCFLAKDTGKIDNHPGIQLQHPHKILGHIPHIEDLQCCLDRPENIQFFNISTGEIAGSVISAYYYAAANSKFTLLQRTRMFIQCDGGAIWRLMYELVFIQKRRSLRSPVITIQRHLSAKQQFSDSGLLYYVLNKARHLVENIY